MVILVCVQLKAFYLGLNIQIFFFGITIGLNWGPFPLRGPLTYVIQSILLNDLLSLTVMDGKVAVLMCWLKRREARSDIKMKIYFFAHFLSAVYCQKLCE